MNMFVLRLFLARASVGFTLVIFLAYSVYGMYLDDKLASYRRFESRLSGSDRWNPSYYPAEAVEAVARYRSWYRWRLGVWLGAIVVGNVLYLLLKP